MAPTPRKRRKSVRKTSSARTKARRRSAPPAPAAARTRRSAPLALVTGITPKSAPADDLTLPAVQFVQAHNTYAYDARPQTANGFGDLVESLYVEGVRGIELDAWQADGKWQWSVAHSGGFKPDPDCQLDTYLRAVSEWSERRRQGAGHEPVVVIVEMKDALLDHGFPDAFDKYAGTALAKSILFQPRSVLHTPEERLGDAIRDPSRWPTLRMMRNTLMVCLSGDAQKNEMYASANHALRLGFADYPAQYTPGDPTTFMGNNRVILSIGSGPGGLLGGWEDVLERIVGGSPDLARAWWDHIEAIGLGEHLADSATALDKGAWCVASDRSHELIPKLGWSGFRRRPVG